MKNCLLKFVPKILYKSLQKFIRMKNYLYVPLDCQPPKLSLHLMDDISFK